MLSFEYSHCRLFTEIVELTEGAAKRLSRIAHSRKQDIPELVAFDIVGDVILWKEAFEAVFSLRNTTPWA